MSTTGANAAVDSTTTSLNSTSLQAASSTTMSTPAANTSTAGTSTSSMYRTSEIFNILFVGRARFTQLSDEEWAQWSQYCLYFYGEYGATMNVSFLSRRVQIMRGLSEEQTRTFSVMWEECELINTLHHAAYMKEELEQLAHELALEAKNEIDPQRERC